MCGKGAKQDVKTLNMNQLSPPKAFSNCDCAQYSKAGQFQDYLRSQVDESCTRSQALASPEESCCSRRKRGPQ